MKNIRSITNFVLSVNGKYSSVLTTNEIQKFREDSLDSQPFCGSIENLNNISLERVIDEGIKLLESDGFKIFSKEEAKSFSYQKKK